jgi:methyl-accepting chemotaxis protein
MIKFFKSSLNAKLTGIFVLPLLISFLFGLIYYPMNQREEMKKNALGSARTLGEMVALAVGTGLNDGNFDLVQNAFGWAKSNPSVAFISILDESASPIVEHNPQKMTVAAAELAKHPGVMDADGTVIAVIPITHNEKKLGTTVLIVSLSNAQDALNKQILWSSIFNIMILALGVTAVVLMARFMVRHINRLGAAMDRFADGDLTIRVQHAMTDELGKLHDSYDRAREGVHTILLRVSQAVGKTSMASAEITTSTEEMAEGTTQQTHQAHEVASAVEEMNKTILENSRNANSTVETARQARHAAEQGGTVVQETIQGMRRIANVVQRSAETVHELGRSSNQIGEIIGVIDDIADQTNLLALNAAIEAARAGDQGRGFAVVADEVRKLAERTTKATKEIADTIRKIQADTQGAVQSMEQGTREVEQGITLADKAGDSLKEIVTVSQRVTDMVTQIAAASEEQSSASSEIAKNVQDITKITGDTASGIRQIAQAADRMRQLTSDLETLVHQFKLSEEGKVDDELRVSADVHASASVPTLLYQ